MDQNIVEKTKERYLEYEKRHQDILDAAIRLFNAKGYNGAKTLEIAREAGISEPTMYKHFENKKALFLACFQSIADELFGQYRRLYREYRDDEFKYLKGVFNVYIDFVANNPDKSMFIIHMLSYWDDPEFKAVYRELMERSIQSISRVIDSAIGKGLLRSQVDSRFLASLFVGNYFLAIAVKEFIPPEQFNGDSFFEPVRMILDRDKV
ncbi:MAG: TetR/AcrR family transcriptional regulator [Proteobacteria bacterium]|nr:TetR/AcrR family transcriptional regulator [Pseudomonadota bacterium]